MKNDHDYCKNPWLESFGTACERSSHSNYEQQFVPHPHTFSFTDDNNYGLMETEIVEEQVYDMGAIGGEVEI